MCIPRIGILIQPIVFISVLFKLFGGLGNASLTVYLMELSIRRHFYFSYIYFSGLVELQQRLGSHLHVNESLDFFVLFIWRFSIYILHLYTQIWSKIIHHILRIDPWHRLCPIQHRCTHFLQTFMLFFRGPPSFIAFTRTQNIHA